MNKPAQSADKQVPGYKYCPVCGRRYQGELTKHLEHPVKGSDGVTRCEWRLCELRIAHACTKLRAAGFMLAGSTGAKVARLLSATHPHLGRHDTGGSIVTKVHKMYLDPKNDLKAWWIQSWAHPVAVTHGWPVRLRARLIAELEHNPEAQAGVNAAWLIGGAEAVRALEGSAVAARCPSLWGNPLDAIISRGHQRPHDRCALPIQHPGGHLGLKTGTLWGGEAVRGVHDLVHLTPPTNIDSFMDEFDVGRASNE